MILLDALTPYLAAKRYGNLADVAGWRLRRRKASAKPIG